MGILMPVLASGELSKVAELARLSLTAEEAARLERELEELFGMFASVSAFAKGEEGREPLEQAPRADRPLHQPEKAALLRKVPGKTAPDGTYLAPKTALE
jgi:Asp-tRNA(Asn)/Glu-tRNA(Gln) amidotransferase C subunit